MNVYRPIALDCTKDNMHCEKLVEQEHGVTVFEITTMSRSKPINVMDCSLAIYHGTKADGHTISNACYVRENKVYLPVSLQMTTCPGHLVGTLELQFNEGNIRFFGLNFEVLPSPKTSEDESSDESTVFEKFILKPEIDGVAGQVLTLNENGDTIWGTVTGEGGISTSDYNSLSNIPTLNGKPIKGDLTSADFGVQNGQDGKDYVLTDTDKLDIARIIMTEYDSELLDILGGDEDVSE